MQQTQFRRHFKSDNIVLQQMIFLCVRISLSLPIQFSTSESLWGLQSMLAEERGGAEGNPATKPGVLLSLRCSKAKRGTKYLWEVQSTKQVEQ